MDRVIDNHDVNAPIFNPSSWKLNKLQTELSAKARKLGQQQFVSRAAKWDRDAVFPEGNYQDLRKEGMLGICIPAEEGGIGADFKTYMLAAAEIGRYCGTTALTFNMHICSCLWTGDLADSLKLPEAIQAENQKKRKLHYKRILEDGAIYSQPFSEGNAAAAGKMPFGTLARKIDKR